MAEKKETTTPPGTTASKGKKRSFVKLVILFWIIVLGGMASTLLVFYGVSTEMWAKLPTFEELENPKSNLASDIITADGKILGKYFKENRTNAEYDELSPHLVKALIATEDERFREHSGIDAKGTARAISYLGTKGGASTITQQLSKMLFHERELNPILRVHQKLQEWVISARLERQYTKDEIITLYFNRFDFLYNAVGIKSAAHVYFSKAPADLTLEESAVLVGMAKNPILFNPIRFPENAIERRNVVLYQMRRSNYITDEEYDSLKVLPITLAYNPVSHKEGLAPYFREVLRSDLHKLFEAKDDQGNYVLAKPDGSPYSIYKDGLKIYTTIDSRMQKYAEYAVSEHLGKELQKDFWRDLGKRPKAPFTSDLSDKEIDNLMRTSMRRTQRYRVLAGKECGNCGRRGRFVETVEEEGRSFYECNAEDCLHKRRATVADSIDIIFKTPTTMKLFSWRGELDTIMSPWDSIRYYKSILQAGFMAMDPHTGFVKAWVGGINFDHFSYDHVRQGKRQVGSTFKPILYSLAIQNGISPCLEIPNIAYTIEKGKWNLLKDWSPKNAGLDFEGMVSLKFGLANSMNNATAYLMKQFGPEAVIQQAKKLGITSQLDPVPSLCLGIADCSVYEMVGANATFANKGVWTEPIYITRIEDKNGQVIKQFRSSTNEVMSEEYAYVMLDLMKGVVDGVYNESYGKKAGTAMRIRGSREARPYQGHRYPIAGKTGTTQNHSDGWFMGITPDLVAGCWVGAEDRSVRFRTLSKGMGTNMALPIWGYFMHKVYEDKTLDISTGDFDKPETPIKVQLDCDKYRDSQKNDTFDSEEEPDFSS